MEFKAFHAKIIKEDKKEQLLELPVVRNVGPVEIKENFKRIKADVKGIIETEMKRILRDPASKKA